MSCAVVMKSPYLQTSARPNVSLPLHPFQTPVKKYVSPTLQKLRNTPRDDSVKVKCERLKEKYAISRYLALNKKKPVLGVSIWPELDVVKRSDWHLLCLTCMCTSVLTLVFMCYHYAWIATSTYRCQLMVAEVDSVFANRSDALHVRHYYLINVMEYVQSLYGTTCDSGSSVVRNTCHTLGYVVGVMAITGLMDRKLFTNRLLPRCIRVRCYASSILLTLLLCCLLALSLMAYAEHQLQGIITTFITTATDASERGAAVSSGEWSAEAVSNMTATSRGLSSCDVVAFWERSYQARGVIRASPGAGAAGDSAGVGMAEVRYYVWAYGCTAASLCYRWLRPHFTYLHRLYSLTH